MYLQRALEATQWLGRFELLQQASNLLQQVRCCYLDTCHDARPGGDPLKMRALHHVKTCLKWTRISKTIHANGRFEAQRSLFGHLMMVPSELCALAAVHTAAASDRKLGSASGRN